MNKKGFTLVEILSVLVLIGLLLGLAIPGINKISNNMKKKSYNKKISLVENAAELWGQDNRTLLQSSSGCEISNGEEVSCYKIKIGDLIGDNYLDSDNNSGKYINPIDNSDMKNSCVYVYKKNNRVYSYFVGEDSNKCLDDKSYELLYSGPKVTTSDGISSGEKHDNNSFTFYVEKDNIPWTNYITKIKTDIDEDYKDFVRDTEYFSNRYNNTKNVDFYFKYCNKERENDCTDETKYVTNLNIPGPELTITPNYSGGWTNKTLNVVATKIGDGNIYFDNIMSELKKTYNENVNKEIEVKECSTINPDDCSNSTIQEIKIDKEAPIITENSSNITLYSSSRTTNYFEKSFNFIISDSESKLKSYVIKDNNNILKEEIFANEKSSYTFNYNFKTSGTVTVLDNAGNETIKQINYTNFISNYYFGPSSNIHNYLESGSPRNYIKISGSKHIRLVLSTNEQVSYNASCSYSQVDGSNLGSKNGILLPNTNTTLYLCNKSKAYNNVYITLKLCNSENACKIYRWNNNEISIDDILIN